MAEQRYSLSREEYEYFLRIFSEAKALPWKYSGQTACWSVDTDVDHPSEEEVRSFGTNYELCLRRLVSRSSNAPPHSKEAVSAKPAAGKKQDVISSLSFWQPVL